MLEYILEQEMDNEDLDTAIADATDEELPVDEDELEDAEEAIEGTDPLDDNPELDFVEDEFDEDDLKDIDIDEEVPVDEDEDDEELSVIADELDAIDAELKMED